MSNLVLEKGTYIYIGIDFQHTLRNLHPLKISNFKIILNFQNSRIYNFIMILCGLKITPIKMEFHLYANMNTYLRM